MKITVKIHPNAKQNKVIKIDDQNYAVYTSAEPHDNLANSAMINLLSEYFQVPKSQITLVHGQKSKTKIINIAG